MSTICAAFLIAIFVGMTIISIILSEHKSNSFQEEESSRNNMNSKGPIAAVSAVVFSAGIFISGMTKHYIICGFLNLTLIPKGYWDPTLMFVMGAALLVSMLSYQFVPEHSLFKVCLLFS